ncbi:Homeodomain-like protein, partial [Dissophora ornata]
MTDSCGSSAEFESYSHFEHQYQSPQLDISFLASHDALRDHHVPALYSTNISDDMPSLGLTGDTAMDDALLAGDQITPRKRIRGERIVWTPEEDEYLRRAVQVYGDKTEKWAKIAACVPGRTNKNCRKRWFHSLDPSLRKGGWTEEEDHLLRTGVQKFRGQWSKIAERIQGRTDDQCAKRWRESLDPDIDRAAWTPEDDMLLLQKFEEYGTQWQRIALSFPGRPGLHCRNRWRKIQRSLNHMERANKRRRNHMSILEGQSGAHKSGESGS